MKYIIDIDDTICTGSYRDSTGNMNYENITPYPDRIEQINQLYDQGHTIKYMTARGSVSGIDHRQLTENQLKSWGAKYHELSVGEKEHYDYWIDDKAAWSESFFRKY